MHERSGAKLEFHVKKKKNKRRKRGERERGREGVIFDDNNVATMGVPLTNFR